MNARRVLVVGPGPARPGAGPAASIVAAELARALRTSGLEVVAHDAAPTSALLWSEAPSRRYLEPLDAATVERVAHAEHVDWVTASVCGPHVNRRLAGGAIGSTWLGGAPSELVAATRGPVDADHQGETLDVVVASDGASAEVLAVFRPLAPSPVALADTEHAVVADLTGAKGAHVEAARALVERERLVGLVTVRAAGGAVLEVDRIDPTLWPAAGLVRGVSPGRLLGHLVLGDDLARALGRSGGARAEVRRRVPSFDFAPYPGADTTLGGIAKSLGATLVVERDAVPEAKKRRVLIVGPSAVRSGHGAEAGVACALAAREVTRLGHEAVVLSTRDATGAEPHARIRFGDDLDHAVAHEAPSDVLAGFGAPDPVGGSDLPTSAWAKAAALEAPPLTRDATELHVVVLSDGAHGKVVGTFEHVERTSVHPDDAAAVFPSLSVEEGALLRCEERAIELAKDLGARGLYTARFAIDHDVALLGVTLGVSTHALSLGLTLGVDVVATAVGLALGAPLEPTATPLPRHVAVEEHVFAFSALGASDTRLDRRRRSTGTVLALGETPARAYARALAAMGVSLRRPGPGGERAVLLAGTEAQAAPLADVGRRLYALGFDVVATEEASRWLGRVRVPHRCTKDAERLVARRGVVAVIAIADDGALLRREALVAGVTCFTTIDLAQVAVRALEIEATTPDVRALEDYM